jgi:hypothetical protein
MADSVAFPIELGVLIAIKRAYTNWTRTGITVRMSRIIGAPSRIAASKPRLYGASATSIRTKFTES